ncbi:carboxypeptidase regulatory-like domain-containing protein [Roseiconus nitratireducens]|nr:carboxypeptidase regulatory-like domain-containing protein [Roseiconus nitratireducens]
MRRSHLFRCNAFGMVLIGLVVGATSAFGQGGAESETKPTSLTGRVVDSHQQGVAHASVVVQYRTGQSRTATARTEADDAGSFVVEVAGNPIAFQQWQVVAKDPQGDQIGFFRYERSEKVTVDSEIEIRVEPAKSATVQIVDADSEPVADASVVAQFAYPHLSDELKTDAAGRVTVVAPSSERINTVVAWKDGVGLDYEVYSLGRDQQSDLKTPVPEFPVAGETLRLEGATPVTLKVLDDSGAPIEGVRLYPWLLRKESANRELNLSFFTDFFSKTSDENGTTTFSWMPNWQKSMVTIWPTAEGYTRTRANYDPATDDGPLEVTLDRLVPVRGRVLDETGNPAAGITVHATGAGYGWDAGRDQTESADDGSYELHVPPEQIYMVTVVDEDWVADAVPGFAVHAGQPVEKIELRLRKPTRLTGRLTAEPSGDPIAAERVLVYQYGDDLDSIAGASLKNPENSRRYVRPTIVKATETDQDGRFEFLLGDGSYDIRPPRQEKAEEFQISGQDQLAIDVTTEIQKKVKLIGVTRHHEDNRPLPQIRLTGASQRFSGDDWQAGTDDEGAFAVERLAEPTYVHAVNADQTLGAVAVLAADQNKIEMRLEPTGRATGVVLQTDSEAPAASIKIHYGIRVPDEKNRTWSNRFGDTAVTDSNGKFVLEGLVPGWEYELNLESRPDGTIPGLGSVKVEPGEDVDMGRMRIPAPRKPYVPPTLDERIAQAMGVAGSVSERFHRAIPRCQLSKQKLLVVLGAADSPRLRRFMQLRYEDKDYRKVRDDFLTMVVSTKDPKDRGDAEQWLHELQADSSQRALAFSLVVVGQDGKLIAQKSGDDLMVDEELSKDAVVQWLRSHIGDPVDARKLLEEALVQAEKENKRVIVQETATWCGPCHLLSNFLNEHRDWEADYLWIKMDHRFTGAREIMSEFRDGASGGIPWFAILDASGDKLATSNHFESGNNIGFPSSDEGRSHFKKMLLETRLTMTDEEIEAFVAELQKDASAN